MAICKSNQTDPHFCWRKVAGFSLEKDGEKVLVKKSKNGLSKGKEIDTIEFQNQTEMVVIKARKSFDLKKNKYSDYEKHT